MKALLVILVVVSVVLTVCTFRMFARIDELTTELVTVKADVSLHAAHAEEFESTVDQALTDARNESSSELARIRENLGAVESRLSKTDGELSQVQKTGQETAHTLSGLMEDLVSKTQAAITEMILADAAARAVAKITDDNALLANEAFIDSIATSLNKNHRQDLRGESGASADNESVAKFLLADPEFLQRVSVQILLHEEESP